MSNQIYIDFHNVIKYAISILFVWNNNIAIISYYNNEAKKKLKDRLCVDGAQAVSKDNLIKGGWSRGHFKKKGQNLCFCPPPPKKNN
jgi:hypothetical protein